MGAIESKEFTSDPAECIACMDCAAPCPQRAISFGQEPGFQTEPAYEFNPTRREVLVSMGTAAAALAVVELDWLTSDNPKLIRPPGVVDEEEFLAKCIRCGQCVKACSSKALHPATLAAGWDAFGTPVLVGALGYCDYDCHACGQVCPSGAIPPLDLATKQQQVMGTAHVIQDLCISCKLCFEICPIEDTLLTVEVTRNRRQVLIPEVVADKCIGCGRCESVCPVEGELAIQVYAPGETPLTS
jgi:MauM/NapG family ferredoxin protein